MMAFFLCTAGACANSALSSEVSEKAQSTYSENTVKGYLSEFSQLESFLKDRNINDYSVSMGVIYKTKREQTSLKPRTRTHISRSILVWNMLLDDSDIPNRRCNNHKWKKIPFLYSLARLHVI